MATVQLRNATDGPAYLDRKKAAGKTANEAMRCLKRRHSDIVYRHMVDDAVRHMGTGPGGQQGTNSDSNAADSHPGVGSSDKSLPGPAIIKPRPAPPSSALTQRGAMSGRSRPARGG